MPCPGVLTKSPRLDSSGKASNEGGERSGTTEHNWEGNGKEVSSVAAGQVQRSILKRLYGLIF